MSRSKSENIDDMTVKELKEYIRKHSDEKLPTTKNELRKVALNVQPAKKSPAKKSPAKKSLVKESRKKQLKKRGLPTDIINIVEDKVDPHSEIILKEANNLYDDAIPRIINPHFVDRDNFVDRYSDLFIDIFGLTFSDFLDKHAKDLKKIWIRSS